MERYKFRPMTIGDVPFFISIRNECRHFLTDDTHFSLEESQDWFSNRNNDFFFILNAGKDIGYFRTSNLNKKTKNIYIGLDLHKEFRSLGHASASYPLFMEMLYKTLGVKSFGLDVLSHNQVACHLYKKLGFIEIDRDVGRFYRSGVLVDVITMMLTRQEG